MANVLGHLEAEARQLEKGATYEKSLLLRLVPTEDGAVADNRIVIRLFRPAQFECFADYYPKDIVDFKVHIEGHYVQMPNESGSMYTQFAVCEQSMDKYYRSIFGAIVGKASVEECPLCKLSSKYWDLYNRKVEALGLKNKKMSKEEYIVAANADSEAKGYRERARRLGKSMRIVLEVVPYDKITGAMPLEDGEQIGFKLLFVPNQIFQQLYEQKRIGYSVTDSVVLISRDTRKGVRYSEYKTNVLPQPLKFESAFEKYYRNDANLVDPSPYIKKLDSVGLIDGAELSDTELDMLGDRKPAKETVQEIERDEVKPKKILKEREATNPTGQVANKFPKPVFDFGKKNGNDDDVPF